MGDFSVGTLPKTHLVSRFLSWYEYYLKSALVQGQLRVQVHTGQTVREQPCRFEVDAHVAGGRAAHPHGVAQHGVHVAAPAPPLPQRVHVRLVDAQVLAPGPNTQGFRV